MTNVTTENQIKRLKNINDAIDSVKKFNNKMRISDDYIPGQVIYNLGDHPRKIDMQPTEYDEKILAKYKELGFGLIQIHADWVDEHRLYGGDKYNHPNPEAAKNFVNLVHSNGIKILPYISSTYLSRFDPAYTPEFQRMESFLVGCYMQLAINWQGSPKWREFIYKKTFDTVEKYGFDGVYNDMGHDWFLKHYFDEINTKGSYSGSITELPYEAEVEDMLALFYEELKSRGMIYKLHIGTYLDYPSDLKLYDYLYVGEGVTQLKEIVPHCRNMRPYLVPAFDRRTCEVKAPDTVYAACIPFMQFPLLYHGRPYLDNSPVVNDKLIWTPTNEFNGNMTNHHYDAVEWLKAHPGEYTYSEWSTIPDDPKELDRAGHYLSLYKPMVTRGSTVRTEITEATWLKSAITEDIYLSMFTNEEQYLVCSNLSDKDYTLVLEGEWTNRETNQVANAFNVPKGKIIFLKK
ncbi:MAG: hypothetical protein IKD20_06745 [Clostridia bacterium]|nr:hypothetical protein [Clostridia bacterium]